MIPNLRVSVLQMPVLPRYKIEIYITYALCARYSTAIKLNFSTQEHRDDEPVPLRPYEHNARMMARMAKLDDGHTTVNSISSSRPFLLFRCLK